MSTVITNEQTTSRTQKELMIGILILILLGAAYVVNAADRQLFPVLLPQINSHLGFTLAEGGFLATIFTFGIGLAGIPAGYLVDKFSRKTVLVAGIFIYSACTILTAAAHNVFDMGAYRVISGVGEAFQIAGMYAAIGAYFARVRTIAFGFLNISYGLGAFLGPYVGAIIVTHYADWRVPFYVYGIAGFAFCVLILALARRKVTEVKITSEVARTTTNLTDCMTPLKHRRSLFCAAGVATSGFMLYCFFSLYPSYLQQVLHYSLETTGYVAGLYGIGGVIGAIIAGFLGARFGNRSLSIAAFVLLGCNGVLMFSGLSNVTLQSIMSFGEGFLLSGIIYVNLYTLQQRLVSSKVIGVASGLFVCAFFLPAGLAGLVFGKTIQALGWHVAGIGLLAALAVIGVVVTFLIGHADSEYAAVQAMKNRASQMERGPVA